MRDADFYVDKRLHAPKLFFDWCYSQIPMIVFSNKNETLSANRKGCEIIHKKLRANTSISFYGEYRCFAIILCTSKRIEVQSYGFYVKYDRGIQHIECELVNFELFENNEHIECCRRFYTKEYMFGLNRQTAMSEPYYNVIFYNNHVDEQLKNKSELRYINWIYPINIEQLRRFYKYRREIEFLQKINAQKMVGELMYQPYKCDMRILNEKWLRKHKHSIKNTNKSFETIVLEEKIKQENGKYIEGAEEYIPYKLFNKIPKCVGIIKFQNWAIKNQINFQFYVDYLNLLKQCNVPISETIACPKDLKKAHAEAVELDRALKKEAEIEKNKQKDIETKTKFDRQLELHKRMEMRINGLAFILPRKATELVNEGFELHHCVSTYINQYASGKTTILFIRDQEEIDRPLYTMEFQNKEIVQIRAKYNQRPPEEVFAAAEIWKKKILDIRRRETNGKH